MPAPISATPASSSAPQSSSVSSLVQSFLRGGSAASSSQTTDPTDINRDDRGDAAGGDQEALPTEVEQIGNDSVEDADDVDPEVDVEIGDESEAGEETAEDEAAPEAKSDVEEITISDERGRRKLKIDFSDKEATKTAYRQAAGMRKFQRERDQERQAHADTQAARELEKPKVANWDKLSKIWDEGGPKALMAHLANKPWAEVYKELRAEEDRVAKMSPAELEAHRRAEKAESDARAAKAAEKEYQDRLKSIDAREEKAETAHLQTELNSGLKRFGFSGKLGDATREHQLNEMLWDSVQASLKRDLAGLKDDDPVPTDLIARTFRQKAKAVAATIQKQVREGTADTLKQKKVEAKENAQALMSKREQRPSTASQELVRDMRSGNAVSGIMKAIGRMASARNK